MGRWLIAGMFALLAACASHAPMAPPPPPPPPPMEPPPPPPPPPPVVVAATPVMAAPAPSTVSVRPRRAVSSRAAPPPTRSAVAAPAPATATTSPVAIADADVQQGVAAFVQPPPMEVDHWYVVEFAVGPTQGNLREQTEGRALAASSRVYVAPLMRVTLLDNPSIEAKPKGPAEQATGLDKTATWLWDVRPKSTDLRALQAKVEVLRKAADGSLEVVDSYTRSVDVSVHVGGMKRTIAAIDDASTVGTKLTGLFGTWQKTVGALVALVGALGLLAWKLGLRKSKPVE